jgi:mRNA interferase MazF
VISPNLINEHSPVILVAALTSRKTDRVFPFETLIEPPDGGLTVRSKILLMQLRALGKRRVRGRIGALSSVTVQKMDSALRIATGLTKL